MANGIRTGDPRGFNKGRCSKFREGSRVRQTPKSCRNNNKDEDNSPKNLNDKNKTPQTYISKSGGCLDDGRNQNE